MYCEVENSSKILVVNYLDVLTLWAVICTYRYKVGCDLPGKYRVALDSDALEFGGHGRVRKHVHDYLELTTTWKK